MSVIIIVSGRIIEETQSSMEEVLEEVAHANAVARKKVVAI